MKTCGLFTTHLMRIKCKPGSMTRLIPFGDIHRDSPMHADGKWKEFLKYGAEHAHESVFLGMGDYQDGFSTSERTVFADERLHESTRKNIENMSDGVTKTLSNELSFMKGKIIGLIGGNHYAQYEDGTNSDNRLAGRLGCRFLGVSCFIRLIFEIGKRHQASIDIWAHHGRAGGRLPGSTFNSIEKMLAAADADIYLCGHDHKRGCIPSTERLRLVHGGSHLSLRHRTPWLGRTGSFLCGYQDGEKSYIVDMAGEPCSLGWIEFELTPSDSNNNISIAIRGIS